MSLKTALRKNLHENPQFFKPERVERAQAAKRHADVKIETSCLFSKLETLPLSLSQHPTLILTHEYTRDLALGSSDYDPVWPKNDKKIYIFDYSE